MDELAAVATAPRMSSAQPNMRDGAPAAGDNETVAGMLREMAGLLSAQQANPFRIAAYRAAAERIASLQSSSVRTIFEREGRAGLDALPGIGPGISAAIAEILSTGRWGQLERLRGDTSPEALFRAIPGVGQELGARIHETLHVDTLEGLELAAADGRLARVPGIGVRRASVIAAVLARMLDRGRARAAPPLELPHPPVPLLLALDREYRRKAAAGELHTIAPRRFNPEGSAWLPVWHVHRRPWHFTILYSNTARAHALGRERDWVVLYFHNANLAERLHTVVTETRGPLAGRRVVRGREPECAAWYERVKAAA